MGVTLVRRTVEGVGAAVGADHPLGMREYALEILLAHRETDHPDVRLAALEQGDGERIWLELLSLCETAKPLAVGGGVGVVADAGDLHVVPPTNEVDLRDGLAADLVGGGGIIEAPQKLFGGPGAAPNGEEIAQPCLIRDVRVAVERDVDARRRGGRGRRSRLGLGAPATRRRCLAALRR